MGVDVGVMWRISEDLNAARRFAVRVQQHHHHHHRQPVSMIYNGKNKFYDIIHNVHLFSENQIFFNYTGNFNHNMYIFRNLIELNYCVCI